MRESLLKLVRKKPGNTASELSHLAGYPVGKTSSVLYELVQQNQLNRRNLPGVNPKNQAWRYFPVAHLKAGHTAAKESIDPKGNHQGRYTLSLDLPWEYYGGAHHGNDHVNPTIDPASFEDFVINFLPFLKPEDLARFIQAAAVQLGPHLDDNMKTILHAATTVRLNPK